MKRESARVLLALSGSGEAVRVTDYLVPSGPENPRDVSERARRLLEEFLKGRSPRTERTYRTSLIQLAKFAGVSLDDLVRELARSMGAANELVTRWKNDMLKRDLKPGTVNGRLVAARSLVRRMRVMGIVPWTLEVGGERAEPYRDTAGPPVEVVGKFLVAAARQGRPDVAARDVALLRCMFDQALRRYEVVGLALEHFERDRGALLVMGKGKRERKPVFLSSSCRAALAAWVEVRARVLDEERVTTRLGYVATDALFLSLSNRNRGDRLPEDGVNKVMVRISRTVHKTPKGKKPPYSNPHGLRHASITAALGKFAPRAVQKDHGRHAKLETTMIYDDNRQELSREIAEAVSKMVEGT